MNQLNIHKRIREFLTQDSSVVGFKFDIEKVKSELFVNLDAKVYFWSMADEKWLDQLFDSGLISNEILDLAAPDEYNNPVYNIPVMGYIQRMANTDSLKVAKIIQKIIPEVHKNNPIFFYPCMWMMREMNAESLKVMIDKMYDENWIEKMSGTHRSGYEFTDVIKTLQNANDDESMFKLAKLLLAVHTVESLQGKEYIRRDDFFIVKDLSKSDIFTTITNLKNNRAEVFEALINTLLGISKLKGESKPTDSYFKKDDPFYLMDIDLYTSTTESIKSYYSDAEISYLVLTIVQIGAEIVKSGTNEDKKKIAKILQEIKSTAPIFWKISIVILSQDPKANKDLIQDYLLNIFENGENYYDFLSGAEYESTLQRTFEFLDEHFKKDFLEKISCFFQEIMKKDKSKNYIKNTLISLISSISKNERNKFQDAINKIEEITGGKVLENFIPEPSMSRGQSGIVSPKSPVENLSEYSVAEIAAKLQNELSPEKLKEEYKSDYFLSPRGPEGLGEALKTDFSLRKDDYISNLELFYNPDKIHSHYLWSIFRAIQDNINLLSISDVQIIINLFEKISEYDDEEAIIWTRKVERDFLADWIEVHKTITDILKLILVTDKFKSNLTDSDKEKIVKIIKYLFGIKASPRKNEEENLKNQDLFSIAINSVRGIAYECFINYLYLGDNKIDDDCKEIFEKALDDDSLAVKFMIGHYFASVYFRDKEWIMLKTTEAIKRDSDSFVAFMEGYMSNSLYEELFAKMRPNYELVINQVRSGLPERKYFKPVEELLATQLALAFVHFNFDEEDSLFKSFVALDNEQAHSEFIKFIGQSYFFQDKSQNKMTKEMMQKSVLFWEKILEKKIPLNKKCLADFSFWINAKEEYISDEKASVLVLETLKQSSGDWSWEYGLFGRLEEFAKINPKHTLEIIRLYYLSSDSDRMNPERKYPLMRVENETYKALEIIYSYSESKENARDLISKLIEVGGTSFWPLEDLVK